MISLTLDLAEKANVNMYKVFSELAHVSEYPRAADRERECPTLFFQGAVFATLLGTLSHLAYGYLTKADVKATSSFAMAMMGVYFGASWVSMILNGRYFASPGFEAGMCMGYEIYAFLMEFVYWYNGKFRKDFMFHHILCMFFSVATAYAWVQIPEVDVSYWLFVWRSICYMLGSNFLANARLFMNTTLVNLLFAITFVVARVFNQLPFIKLSVLDTLELGFGIELLEKESKTKALMWESHWTTALVVAWAFLVILNFYWSFKVIQVVYWKITKQTKSTKAKEAKKVT